MSSGNESIGWRENLAYFQSKLNISGRNKRNRTNRMGGERFPLDITFEGDTGITQQWERQMDKEAVEKFNAKVRAWGAKVHDGLMYSTAQWIAEDEELSKSIKENYRHWGKAPKKGEEITSVGFGFEVNGIYVHLGVGRGYNMEGGTRVMTKKHNRTEWKRKPKPWFNPVIAQNIPELVEIVKEYCGKLFINTTRIYINR